MLHIISTLNGIDLAVAYAQDGDEFLLTQAAVYAANPQHKAYKKLTKRACHFLLADIQARGLDSKISNSKQIVDFSGFVSLTERHSQSIHWQ
jgi:tRNA 2-thiouridine synthesizing protein B